MVNAAYVQDKIYYGYDQAAKRLGYEYTIYRATNGLNPISPGNIVGTVFVSPHQNDEYTKPNKYGNSVWMVYHDGRLTRPSDYLVTTEGYSEKIFFIISQQLLLPIQAVDCNRRLTITRPTGTDLPGKNPYGGYSPSQALTLMQDVPASVLIGTHAGETNPLKLPLDTRLPRFQILIPQLPGVELRIGDIVEDERGVRIALTSVELTDLGYRLNASSVQI